MGGIFNHPLEKVIWPPNLEKLELGQAFTRGLGGVKWPGGLKFVMVQSRRDPGKKVWLKITPPGTVVSRVDVHTDAPPMEDDLPPGLESSMRHLFESFTATGNIA